MTRLIAFFCLGLGLMHATGCAYGREHAYHDRAFQVQRAAQPAQRLAIAVHDQREEIVSGDKAPNFVGLSRGGWGNPFDVTTATDAPLADAMAESVARGFDSAGYRTRVVPVAPTATPQQVAAALTKTGAARLVLLRLIRWKSDTYQNTSLHYDVDLEVLDGEGKRLAHKHERGDDNLGGNMWSPGGHADKAVPEAFQKLFEALLNDHEITRALRNTPAPAAGQAAISRVPRS